MKPPESLPLDDPRSWLHHAHSDLWIAKADAVQIAVSVVRRGDERL